MDLSVLRDVEIRHLSALRAVVEEGSFGQAAHRLGFTQSAISQQVAAFERIVGEALFERRGGPRPVRLTPAGSLLLNHANAILDRLHAAEADLVAYRVGEAGTLAVGTFQSVSVRLLPLILAELHDTRPDLDVQLSESDDQEEMLTRLHHGELDLTFAVQPVASSDLATVSLYRDPFVLLCPPDSPLAASPNGARPVPLTDLSGVHLVGQHITSCQLQIEQGLARGGISPRIVFRTGDNAAVQAMVRAGVGHAVMPLLAVDANDPGVAVRALEPPIEPREIVLARVRDRALAPAAELFCELALRHAATLAAGEPRPPYGPIASQPA